MPGGKKIKGGPYWIEYYDATGKQQREPTGLYDFKAADAIRFQRIAQKRAGVLVTPRTSKVTVGELLDDLLLCVRQNGKCVELAQYHCNHLRESLGPVPAAKIGTEDIQRYIKARLDAGVCGGTVNRELTRLRRAFQLGMDHEPPKILRIPKFPTLAENPPRHGFLERNQYESLLRELPDYLKPVLSFGYYSGCRQGEILGLEWSQVDLTQGIVRLRPQDTKTKEPRLFAVVGDLLQMMTMLHDQRCQLWPTSQRVFTRSGEPIRDFRGAWAAATTRAGIPGTLFHDLRRTAVRNMVRAGIPEEVAMRISGHKTRSVFQRYNIVNERDMIDAGRKVAAFLESQAQSLREASKGIEPQAIN